MRSLAGVSAGAGAGTASSSSSSSSSSSGADAAMLPHADGALAARFAAGLAAHPFFASEGGGLDWAKLRAGTHPIPDPAWVPSLPEGQLSTAYIEDTLEPEDMRLTANNENENDGGGNFDGEKIGTLKGISRVFASFYFDGDGDVDMAKIG